MTSDLRLVFFCRWTRPCCGR